MRSIFSPLERKAETVTTIVKDEAEVIVIGGGIAGVAAALRLKDRGLTPLVLERESRVGGRMTTDRIEGFAIDRGVTLMGNQFTRMRSLCRRLGLKERMVPAPFSLGLHDHDTCHGFRAGHGEDILKSSMLSSPAKAAFLKLSAELVFHGLSLSHGRSDLAFGLDDKTAADYFHHLGEGGQELFERLLVPGFRGPVGGDPWGMSRAALMQVIWNILVRGTWNLSGGIDAIPEAIAAEVPVRTDCRVTSVRREGSGVRVTAETDTEGTVTFQARAAIFALPGQLVSPLCSDLPFWLTDPLGRTEYSRMVSAHIALDRQPDSPYPGIGFAVGFRDGVEMELEHLRAPENGPKGQGMVSLYFYPCPGTDYPSMTDAELRLAAVHLLEQTFPEITGASRFVHLIRWESGIAKFPPGRMTEMVRLRERLRALDLPFEFCGDYWDGIASESALRTGEQAAERLVPRIYPRRCVDKTKQPCYHTFESPT
jgi:oxygen-dependent protoporphyrinogen oxidase